MRVFIHGLGSSSMGVKGSWLRKRFPEMEINDYQGDLAARLAQLEEELSGLNDLILVGSSFGGLMALIHALVHPDRVKRLILLAPALNFPGLEPYQGRQLPKPVHLFIGKRDKVTPPRLVEPVARRLCLNLEYHLVDDDHLLRKTFEKIPWDELL